MNYSILFLTCSIWIIPIILHYQYIINHSFLYIFNTLSVIHIYLTWQFFINHSHLQFIIFMEYFFFFDLKSLSIISSYILSILWNIPLSLITILCQSFLLTFHQFYEIFQFLWYQLIINHSFIHFINFMKYSNFFNLNSLSVIPS